MIFAVPFTAPAGLPIITATATDPQGNTSEVSSQRPGGLQAPVGVVRLAPGQASLTFSAASGDGIALQDPDAGPLDPTWDLTLSVSAGTLTLASTAGLVGLGRWDGIAVLQRPALGARTRRWTGMTFTPPPGFQGTTPHDPGCPVGRRDPAPGPGPHHRRRRSW